MSGKIENYPNSVTQIEAGDYIDVAKHLGGGVYESQKLPGDVFLGMFKQENINSDVAIGFLIPAGHRITSIVIEEETGNPAGNISIGLSGGADEIVHSQPVGANGFVDCPIIQRLFSKTVDQQIFISSDGWGSGQVTIYVKLEKVII